MHVAAEQIFSSISKAQRASSLAQPHIDLLAASKSQPAALIEEAIAAGISVFGENRVQEATEKWPEIRKKHPQVSLQLIGPLQTNKVEAALTLFDVIQTVDRPKLAEALAAERNEASRTRAFYIQVNTGKEPQKAGILPAEAKDFIAYCKQDLRLPIIGLMCIPPHDQPAPAHFAFLRELAQQNQLSKLSMGMSEDFEIAVRMGSSCVRVGRALFGERN